MKPVEFDRLSFREIMLAIRAADDVDKEAWRRTATVCTYVYNHGGTRGKGFKFKTVQALFPKLYGGRTMLDFEEKLARAREQERKYLAAHAAAEARRKTNGNRQ